MNELDRNLPTRPDGNEAARIKDRLQSALQPVPQDLEHNRDLWPAMLRRMHTEDARGVASVPWFDWALATGLLAFAAVAPRTIPVILYYL